MIHRFIFIASFVLFVFGAGCVPTVTVLEPAPLSPKPAWEEVGNGVERLQARFGPSPSNGTLLLYRFPRQGWSWSIEHSTNARSVRDWAEQISGPAIVTNGGYFHEDNMPSGALISHGQRIGSRSFDPDKSALVILSPEPRLVDQTRYPTAIEDAQDALQTYPYLLRNGEGSIAEDSGRLAERTFIGTDREGRIYLGVAMDASVSLYELMHILLAQPVEWRDVVNLDGGPSTGFVASFENENRGRNSLTPVPNVIVGRFTPSASSTSPSP